MTVARHRRPSLFRRERPDGGHRPPLQRYRSVAAVYDRRPLQRYRRFMDMVSLKESFLCPDWGAHPPRTGTAPSMPGRPAIMVTERQDG